MPTRNSRTSRSAKSRLFGRPLFPRLSASFISSISSWVRNGSTRYILVVEVILIRPFQVHINSIYNKQYSIKLNIFMYKKKKTLSYKVLKCTIISIYLHLTSVKKRIYYLSNYNIYIIIKV